MTNKLVVIIKSLKVQKIKKILLYEIKFLVPSYSCLQNPWLGGYRPQIPVLSVLCPQLNLLNIPSEQNSWVRHLAMLPLLSKAGKAVTTELIFGVCHVDEFKEVGLINVSNKYELCATFHSNWELMKYYRTAYSELTTTITLLHATSTNLLSVWCTCGIFHRDACYTLCFSRLRVCLIGCQWTQQDR